MANSCYLSITKANISGMGMVNRFWLFQSSLPKKGTGLWRLETHINSFGTGKA